MYSMQLLGALSAAIKERNDDMLRAILQPELSVNVTPLLELACESFAPWVAAIAALLAYSGPGTRTGFALHKAAHCCCVANVEVLLAHGADANTPSVRVPVVVS